MNKKHAIWTAVAVVIFLAGLYYFTRPVTLVVAPPEGTVCTMDAKQCPDGSYVGRTGPNCEFSLCPNPQSTSMTNSSSSLTSQMTANTPSSPADLYK